MGMLDDAKLYGKISNIDGVSIIIVGNDTNTLLKGDDTEGFTNLKSLVVSRFICSANWNGLKRDKFCEFIVDSENEIFESCSGVLYTKKGYDRNGKIKFNMKELVACPTLVESHTIMKGTTRISNCAFKGCKISKIVIPEGLEEIGVNAFYMTSNLKDIEIPISIKRIESQNRLSFTKVKYDNHEFNSWNAMIEFMLNNGFVRSNYSIVRL